MLGLVSYWVHIRVNVRLGLYLWLESNVSHLSTETCFRPDADLFPETWPIKLPCNHLLGLFLQPNSDLGVDLALESTQCLFDVYATLLCTDTEFG